eukprot:GHVN01023240.1.p1 GENE.GHVN01023240.1~~GHVN01023240.1.p1  ORF type:complete len:577 (+),score=87.42 GHVN01023240.1:46-1776(+)
MQKGSILATTLVLVASSIGTGILTLPWAIRESGLLLGPLLLLLSAVVCNISMNILMIGAKEANCTTYASLIMKCTRWKPIGVIIDFLIFLEVVLAVASYLIFLGDFVPRLAAEVPDLPQWMMWMHSRTFVIIIFAIGCYPICLPSKLSFLRHGSVISVACLLYVTSAVVFRAPHYLAHPPSQVSAFEHPLSYVVGLNAKVTTTIGSQIEQLDWVRPGWGALRTLLISTYAFFCHFNVIPAGGELKDNSTKRMMVVNVLTTSSLVVFYAILSTAGYVSWGNSTEQDFINNYPVGDKLFTFARVMLTLTMIIMIPLQLHPMFASLLGLLSAVGIGVGAQSDEKDLYLSMSENERNASPGYSSQRDEIKNEKNKNNRVTSTTGSTLNSTDLDQHTKPHCMGLDKPFLPHQSPLTPSDKAHSPSSSPKMSFKLSGSSILGNLALGSSLVHSSNDMGDAVIMIHSEAGGRRVSTSSVYSFTSPDSTLNTPLMKAASVAFIMVLNVVLALFFTKIANLIALIGGTFDTLFVITLPIFVYTNLFAHKHPKVISYFIQGLLWSCTVLCFAAAGMIVWDTFLGDP